jgi:oxygen-independent coproporphyrinogen III oxidase
MSGIYIHIPFCKQACHYCDFHFSTNLKKKNEMVLALAKEIEMRSKSFTHHPSPITESIETIYFGGGTPSILSVEDLRFLIDSVYKNYKVVENPEITVEANPDDLNLDFDVTNEFELSKKPGSQPIIYWNSIVF